MLGQNVGVDRSGPLEGTGMNGATSGFHCCPVPGYTISVMAGRGEGGRSQTDSPVFDLANYPTDFQRSNCALFISTLSSFQNVKSVVKTRRGGGMTTKMSGSSMLNS